MKHTIGNQKLRCRHRMYFAFAFMLQCVSIKIQDNSMQQFPEDNTKVLSKFSGNLEISNWYKYNLVAMKIWRAFKLEIDSKLK